jgi:hypothetical protein
MAGKVDTEDLRGPDDRWSTDLSPSGFDASGSELDGPRLLEDPDSEPFNGSGETADEFERMYGGGMRSKDGAECPGHPTWQFGRGEPGIVGLIESPFAFIGQHLAEVGHMGGVGGEGKDAAFSKIAIDALSGDDSPNFVDCPEHLSVKGYYRFAAMGSLQPFSLAGDLAGAPASVTARGAVASNLCLDHDHPQVWLGAL